MVGAAGAGPAEPQLLTEHVERVRGLAADYEAPDFAEAPGPDTALFLCAIDHSSGYQRPHAVDGDGPFDGSALLWAVGCAAERREPGLLSAASLAAVEGDRVQELFEIEGETVSGPEERARLWRDLAAGLDRDYGGSAAGLLVGAESSLGGSGGLIARLAGFEAYADPLAKKSFLFAKIAARRGWFEVADPESWEVCADNVLMRIALRCGLVRPGPVEVVRARTRAALKQLAIEAGLEPPLLDDLLWELGRDDPDLLGTDGGDLSEPPRDPASDWY